MAKPGSPSDDKGQTGSVSTFFAAKTTVVNANVRIERRPIDVGRSVLCCKRELQTKPHGLESRHPVVD